VLLKLLEELRIVLIILGRQLTFVHEILPGLLKYLSRGLGRLTESSHSPFQRCKERTLDCSTRNERSMKPSPT
jgi:hypothetical protein